MFYSILATPEEEQWFSKLSFEEKAKIYYTVVVARGITDFVYRPYDTLSDEKREEVINDFKALVEKDGMPSLALIRFRKWMRDNCDNITDANDVMAKFNSEFHISQ